MKYKRGILEIKPHGWPFLIIHPCLWGRIIIKPSFLTNLEPISLDGLWECSHSFFSAVHLTGSQSHRKAAWLDHRELREQGETCVAGPQPTGLISCGKEWGPCFWPSGNFRRVEIVVVASVCFMENGFAAGPNVERASPGNRSSKHLRGMMCLDPAWWQQRCETGRLQRHFGGRRCRSCQGFGLRGEGRRKQVWFLGF